MRLIDADDFKKFIEKLTELGAPYAEIVLLLDRQPTIEERLKGKWESYIEHDRFDGYNEDCEPIYRDMKVYRCPFCGSKIHDWATNYCADCGAELEVE